MKQYIYISRCERNGGTKTPYINHVPMVSQSPNCEMLGYDAQKTLLSRQRFGILHKFAYLHPPKPIRSMYIYLHVFDFYGILWEIRRYW